MHVLVGVVLYMVAFTGALTAWHWQLHGLFSPLQFALAAFCALNVRAPAVANGPALDTPALG